MGDRGYRAPDGPATFEAAGAAPAGDRPRPPKVTVVVLNWCREEDTAACIRSLLESDYVPLEILLVDNGSPDGSGGRLHQRFADVSFLPIESNLGYTGGNNQGIERALGGGAEYVLILNNDTVIAVDGITRLVAAAGSRPRPGAVAPKILHFDRPDLIWFAGGTFSRHRAVGRHHGEGERDDPDGDPEVQSVTFLSGCCLLLPAAALRDVGGFAEDFFAYVEDVDLSARLLAAGYELLYEPRARVLHRVPVSPADPSPSQIFFRDRNRRRFVRRNYRRRDRLVFASFFYPTRIVHLARYLFRGDRERAAAIWRGMTIP